MPIEIEKKFRLTDDQKREMLTALDEFGAVYEGEDVEENLLFSNGGLREKNAVVRIRRTQERSTLTYKQRLQNDTGAKHQLEYESVVDDAEAVGQILESLGFRKSVVYEKRRRTFTFRDVEVVIDELPFGTYMEIEGPLSAIAEAEMLLGTEDIEVEHETYPRLAGKMGKRCGDVIEARF